MKLTYQFMDKLVKLLRNENWRSDLESRIIEINQELSLLDEKTSNDIQNKINKWQDLEEKANGKDESVRNKILPSQDKQEELIEKIRESAEESRLKLTKEIEELTLCIKEGKYKLGLGAFEKTEDASLLLLHIHFLYSKDMNFNSEAVSAVELMLKENFNDLYRERIDRYAEPFSTSQISLVKEYILGKITKDSNHIDILKQVFSDDVDNMTPEQKNECINYLKSIVALDQESIIYSYEKLKPFIIWFTYNNYDSRWDNLVFPFAMYFSSPENLDNYLEKEIDWSNFETIENGLDMSNLSNIYELSMEERIVWYSLNAAFSKKAMKLFGQAHDLKSRGFDIVERSNTLENLDSLFTEVKQAIKEIRFVREEENEELGQLCRLYNIKEATFNRILDEISPNITSTNELPDITLSTSDNKFTLTKLPAGDLRALLLGKMTACCQFIGGDSEKCVIDGLTKNSAGFYILTDRAGTIKAQSYAWIGRNSTENKVLILDSYEHLPEAKKYFLELVQNLSQEIKKFGYEELYVGTGGKTPSLNSPTFEIAAQDPDLYRYYDSKILYKITPETTVSENSISFSHKPYENFNEFINDNKGLSFDMIKSLDINEELEKLSDNELIAIKDTHSPILCHLLSKGSITISEIVTLFKDHKEDTLRSSVIFSNHSLKDKALAWEKAIKSYLEDDSSKDFISLVKNMEIQLSNEHILGASSLETSHNIEEVIPSFNSNIEEKGPNLLGCEGNDY